MKSIIKAFENTFYFDSIQLIGPITDGGGPIGDKWFCFYVTLTGGNMITFTFKTLFLATVLKWWLEKVMLKMQEISIEKSSISIYDGDMKKDILRVNSNLLNSPYYREITAIEHIPSFHSANEKEMVIISEKYESYHNWDFAEFDFGEIVPKIALDYEKKHSIDSAHIIPDDISLRGMEWYKGEDLIPIGQSCLK